MTGAAGGGAILEVHALHVTYESAGRAVHAVQDASLSVAEGEAVGIAGESGCGKSTLARVLLGLVPAGIAHIRNGRIAIGGVDVTGFAGRDWEQVRGQPVAIVFQDPLSFLNPVMRVGDQIGEAVRRHDSAAAVPARSAELVDLVRLQRSVLRRYPHELSGGMRQRVMLAIALGCRPRLLVADEPTTALDATTEAEILALLRELRRELGMAMLLISHDLGVLRWNCDRIYIMYAGHTVESGATAEVLSRPAHPYTRGLAGAARLARLPDGHFAMIGGDVPRLERPARLCPFLSRCDAAMARCREAMPPALPAGANGHQARCWLIAPAHREAI